MKRSHFIKSLIALPFIGRIARNILNEEDKEFDHLKFDEYHKHPINQNTTFLRLYKNGEIIDCKVDHEIDLSFIDDVDYPENLKGKTYTITGLFDIS